MIVRKVFEKYVPGSWRHDLLWIITNCLCFLVVWLLFVLLAQCLLFGKDHQHQQWSVLDESRIYNSCTSISGCQIVTLDLENASKSSYFNLCRKLIN